MLKRFCRWTNALLLVICVIFSEAMSQDLHFKCHDKLITDIAFSPDDTILASSSDDNTIVLSNAKDGTTLATFSGHNQKVTDIAFSRNGKLLASASHDGKAKLWDVEKRSLRYTLSGHKYILGGVEFCPDDRTLLSVAKGRELKAWSIVDGTFLYELPEAEECRPGNPIAFSPDGKLLATGGVEEFPVGVGRDVVMIWTWPDRKVISCIEPDLHITLALAFSSDCRRLAVGGVNGVRLLDVATNTLSDPIEPKKKWRWSGDLLWLKGDDILLGGMGRVQTWQLPDSNYDVAFDQEVEFPLAMSHDGKRLAYRLHDNSIKVMSIDTAVVEKKH